MFLWWKLLNKCRFTQLEFRLALGFGFSWYSTKCVYLREMHISWICNTQSQNTRIIWNWFQDCCMCMFWNYLQIHSSLIYKRKQAKERERERERGGHEGWNGQKDLLSTYRNEHLVWKAGFSFFIISFKEKSPSLFALP